VELAERGDTGIAAGVREEGDAVSELEQRADAGRRFEHSRGAPPLGSVVFQRSETVERENLVMSNVAEAEARDTARRAWIGGSPCESMSRRSISWAALAPMAMASLKRYRRRACSDTRAPALEARSVRDEIRGADR